jgi:hypothetical protein
MADESEPMIQVFNPDTEKIIELPVRKAAAGMIAYARRDLGRGTPACAEHERRAVMLLRKHGYDTRGRKIQTGAEGND